MARFMNWFEELPPELLGEVISHMDPNTQKAFATTCKSYLLLVDTYGDEPLCLSAAQLQSPPLSDFIAHRLANARGIKLGRRCTRDQALSVLHAAGSLLKCLDLPALDLLLESWAPKVQTVRSVRLRSFNPNVNGKFLLSTVFINLRKLTLDRDKTDLTSDGADDAQLSGALSGLKLLEELSLQNWRLLSGAFLEPLLMLHKKLTALDVENCVLLTTRFVPWGQYRLLKLCLERTACGDEDTCKLLTGTTQLESLVIKSTACGSPTLATIAEFCPNLKTLNALKSHAQVDGLEKLAGLTKIEMLMVGGPELNISASVLIDIVGSLPKLHLLDLGEAAISDTAFSSLFHAPALKSLQLAHSRKLKAEAAPVPQLVGQPSDQQPSSLQALSLFLAAPRSFFRQDSFWHQLNQLRVLDLGHNKWVNDRVCSAVSTLPLLEELNISTSAVQAKGVKTVTENAKALKKLDISYCPRVQWTSAVKKAVQGSDLRWLSVAGIVESGSAEAMWLMANCKSLRRIVWLGRESAKFVPRTPSTAGYCWATTASPGSKPNYNL